MRIWLALLVAPMLALADQGVGLSMATWACAHQLGTWMHAVHFVFLAAAAASTFLAWQAWRAADHAYAQTEAGARRRFVAGLALATGAFSTLVIVALWVPNWVLSPCIA
jgi:hypothetical protein